MVYFCLITPGDFIKLLPLILVRVIIERGWRHMSSKRRYVITLILFVVILFVGKRFWQWREMETAFLLLFFFLVTIGIRLADIVKKIGATNDRLDRLIRINARLLRPDQGAIVDSPEQEVSQSPDEKNPRP